MPRVHKVLLPKAYIRYRLTGEMIEEMSDASGTLWLDVGTRKWSDAALSATGLTRDAMPCHVWSKAMPERASCVRNSRRAGE